MVALHDDVGRESRPLNIEYSREFLCYLLCNYCGRCGGLPDLGHRCNTALCEATGHDQRKREEVKIDIERKSMNRDSVIDSHSNRGNLRVGMIPAHPDAGAFLNAIAFNAPSQECMDQDLFQLPDILFRP